jgi:hypothetical protein
MMWYGAGDQIPNELDMLSYEEEMKEDNEHMEGALCCGRV